MTSRKKIWSIASWAFIGLFAFQFAALNSIGEEASQLSQPTGVLGKGTIWATPWFVVESGQDGPTVFITGGIHGNEPSGSAAAEQIRHWGIETGRLVVVPRVNRLGLTANMRWFPPERNDKSLRDMNRNFPTKENPAPRTPLAEALWELVEDIQPDYVIDLHEGFDFHIANSKSVGSSVIFTKSKHRTELATAMLEKVNATIENEDRKLIPLSRSGAVKGGLVRACQDILKIDGFILETTFKDQPLSLRTRQHRVMVSTLFQKIGVTSKDFSNQLVPAKSSDVIQLAMFDSTGATANGIKNFTKLFSSSDEINLTVIGPADMQSGVLNQFDVVLFPGGSGSKQGKAIGVTGRDAVREFVDDGGGIVGVCAGAFLCSSHYNWSLHVINTAVFNKTIEIPGVGKKSMWYRGGPSDVQMEFSPSARELLGREDHVKVRYQNGPIISKGTNTKLPDYIPLAWFRSEVSKYEPQKGTMVDTPAIVTAMYGAGRVISISPHPEATPGLESVILEAVKSVANSQR